ncbi:MAG: hypothetical protein QOH50_5011 [Kribbellaceae bacterium]|jgi:hypothetical protein|nr:hypothetical protein [Kribbellaceae bacterium]
MSSLPPELVDLVERLRATLVEINDSEQDCMANVVASASQAQHVPEIQAVMARCRQTSAAAAATAIDTFRDECSEIGAHSTSLTEVAIVSATAKSVAEFWMKLESSAAAFAAEAAALLPDHGPDKTTQSIRNTCSDRASSINRHFEQLAT